MGRLAHCTLRLFCVRSLVCAVIAKPHEKGLIFMTRNTILRLHRATSSSISTFSYCQVVVPRRAQFSLPYDHPWYSTFQDANGMRFTKSRYRRVFSRELECVLLQTHFVMEYVRFFVVSSLFVTMMVLEVRCCIVKRLK